jgi:hypothetical protein
MNFDPNKKYIFMMFGEVQNQVPIDGDEALVHFENMWYDFMCWEYAEDSMRVFEVNEVPAKDMLKQFRKTYKEDCERSERLEREQEYKRFLELKAKYEPGQ